MKTMGAGFLFAVVIFLGGCVEDGLASLPPPPIVDCSTLIVLFDEGSVVIEGKYRDVLQKALLSGVDPCYSAHATDPRWPIATYVTGNADKSGSNSANEQLALRRAEAVAEYLVELGVPRERMCVRARGSREPLAPTQDDFGRESQNRRVDVQMMGGGLIWKSERCR